MHTFEYPIVIDGKGYYVERVFSGGPAIYKGVSMTHKGHIDEPDLVEPSKYTVNEPGAVIIIARQTEDSIEIMNER